MEKDDYRRKLHYNKFHEAKRKLTKINVMEKKKLYRAMKRKLEAFRWKPFYCFINSSFNSSKAFVECVFA